MREWRHIWTPCFKLFVDRDCMMVVFRSCCFLSKGSTHRKVCWGPETLKLLLSITEGKVTWSERDVTASVFPQSFFSSLLISWPPCFQLSLKLFLFSAFYTSANVLPMWEKLRTKVHSCLLSSCLAHAWQSVILKISSKLFTFFSYEGKGYYLVSFFFQWKYAGIMTPRIIDSPTC